jgi:hypothetical protein
MPQDMRRQILKYPGALAVFIQLLPEGLAGERTAARGDEKRSRLAALQQGPSRAGQIQLDRLQRASPGWDYARLAALSSHPNEPKLRVHRRHRQAHQLRYAQPAGVQQFEHRAIAQARRLVRWRRGQQCLNLRARQVLRQVLPLLRRAQQRRGVFLDPPLTQKIPE